LGGVSSFELDISGFFPGVPRSELGTSSFELGTPGFELGTPGFELGFSRFLLENPSQQLEFPGL
jgi:hypothetical protein